MQIAIILLILILKNNVAIEIHVKTKSVITLPNIQLSHDFDNTHAPVTCELCITSVLHFNRHMRNHHPGCGKSCGHMGYRSNGSYVDGWFGGDCGSGAPYFLMCRDCRKKYLQGKTSQQSPIAVDLGMGADGGVDGMLLFCAVPHTVNCAVIDWPMRYPESLHRDQWVGELMVIAHSQCSKMWVR